MSLVNEPHSQSLTQIITDDLWKMVGNRVPQIENQGSNRKLYDFRVLNSITNSARSYG